MQIWDKNLFWNYQPSYETLTKGLIVMEKLGKLNVRMANVFSSHKMPVRIFAFIESKYSSRIEGIYTTLFDVVNTGEETKQQKLIKPLVDAIFKEKNIISMSEILRIEEVLNSGISKTKRFESIFGIYQQHKEEKIKIYTPPLIKSEIDELLKELLIKVESDSNIIQILHSHILFEKIHPFVDGNGRIGRLILQKSLTKLINFTSIIPLSWAFFKELSKYYEAFDIEAAKDIDDGVQKFLDIILIMYKVTKEFLVELKTFKDKNLPKIIQTSRVVNEQIAEDILLTLQTKSVFMQRVHKLNPRTIDAIFEKLNVQYDLPFNEKVVMREKVFWNVELETIIDKCFN